MIEPLLNGESSGVRAATHPALVRARLQMRPPRTAEYVTPPSAERNRPAFVPTSTMSAVPLVSTLRSGMIVEAPSLTLEDHVSPPSVER
jgi:hypothetical protein